MTLEEQDHGPRDRLVGDDPHRGLVGPRDRHGARGGLADRDAVGDGGRPAGDDRCRSAPDRVRERAGTRRLDADEPDRRVRLGDREGRTGEQAAAAHGHHDRVKIGAVQEHLPGDRALTGDDGRIIEGMDVDCATLRGEVARRRECLVVAGACDDHLRARALDRGQLGERHAAREDDARGDAERSGTDRDTQSVVASGRGDHAAPALRRIEHEEPRERAAQLEGAGALQVLELEVDLAAGERREIR